MKPTITIHALNDHSIINWGIEHHVIFKIKYEKNKMNPLIVTRLILVMKVFTDDHKLTIMINSIYSLEHNYQFMVVPSSLACKYIISLRNFYNLTTRFNRHTFSYLCVKTTKSHISP